MTESLRSTYTQTKPSQGLATIREVTQCFLTSQKRFPDKNRKLMKEGEGREDLHESIFLESCQPRKIQPGITVAMLQIVTFGLDSTK
jgi:hypothetical protein